MKKTTIIESIASDTVSTPSFKSAKFRTLIESILSDEDNSVEGFDELPQDDDDTFEGEGDDLEASETEGEDDGLEAEPAAEADVDTAADAGSVTIEFTADEVALLRSILNKIDATQADEDADSDDDDADFLGDDDEDLEGEEGEPEETEGEDDGDFEDEEEEESDEEEDDFSDEDEEDLFEEDEEAYADEEDEATTAPRRKVGTPAVNRSGKATAPVIDNAVAGGKHGEAATGKGAPKRSKFNGEPKRGQVKHEGDRYTEGEVLVKVGK